MLGIVLVGPLGVRGLALSVSIAYTVAAVIALSVVAGKDNGLGGQELTIPVTRVLIATAVMALATVLAVNVSAADTGFALFSRVALAVVVGALAFVATTVALAALQERRVAAARAARSAERPEPLGPAPVLAANGPVPGGSGPDGPRQRAAHSSIRLITPETETAAERSQVVSDDPSDDAPVVGFRDRLGEESDEVPVRHLRPVPEGLGIAPRSEPRGSQTAGGAPAEEAEGVAPPEDEEEPHGPDPGGNR